MMCVQMDILEVINVSKTYKLWKERVFYGI